MRLLANLNLHLVSACLQELLQLLVYLISRVIIMAKGLVDLLKNVDGQCVLNEANQPVLALVELRQLALLLDGDVHQVLDALLNDALDVDPFVVLGQCRVQVLHV